MTEIKKRKYAVIDELTGAVVVEHLQSRQEARIAKRALEDKQKAANGFRPTPSRYYVETDIDHKDGAGIYYH